MSQKGLKETYIPALKRIGMECSGYAPTKMNANTNRGKFGHKHIGCAMFYNPLKLELRAASRVHLKDFAPLDR